MSIVYSADVFCDAPSCGLWEHGLVHRQPPTKGEARKAVRREYGGWTTHAGKDYCPDHVLVRLPKEDNDADRVS